MKIEGGGEWKYEYDEAATWLLIFMMKRATAYI